ncbi:MAG: conjugal transfer protein TraN, partial [Endozoicomonas sp.]
KVGSYRESTVLGLASLKFNRYCCFSSPLSRILQVQIRKQLNLGWGSPKHPDCAGISPETLQAVNWDQIDLGEWLALLKLQNKLPELNAETLKQLNLETLTGKSSRLDFNQQREDSRKRLEARYEGINTWDLNEYHNQKSNALRHMRP